MFEKNIIKNRIRNLEKKICVLRTQSIHNKKNRLENIKKKLKTLFILNKKNQIQVFQKELLCLENIISTFNESEKEIKNISDFIELAIEISDKNFYQDTINEINNLEKKIKKLEFFIMFSHKNDVANCYLDIQSGSGGNEAQDWSSILLRMYLRWAEYKGFKTDIISVTKSEFGLKAVTVHIRGNYAYGWFRTETGIHRLVRKSPFNANHRRHTSFSSVFIYPEVNNDIGIEIKHSDLRIDVYRASGAGGQHVNRTESAVRITHIPTNIVTQCQNSRSQHHNKEQALKQMLAKLYDIEIKKKNAEKKELENNKSNIGWGNQIRSYVLDHARIKDLRTKIETRNVQSVLDGDLDIFIEESLRLGL